MNCKIFSFYEKCVYVTFENRNVKYLHNPFEHGYLKYENLNC